ncbi:MAG: hypothetical protein K2P51_04290 [Rhabdochlamydiaceae bacterium]|nr:hypothetical protein [Rhabdochlamydiaceae bacterium]
MGSSIPPIPTAQMVTFVDDGSASSKDASGENTTSIESKEATATLIPPLILSPPAHSNGHTDIASSSSSSSDYQQASPSSDPATTPKEPPYRKLFRMVSTPFEHNPHTQQRRQRSISSNEPPSGLTTTRQFFSKFYKTLTPRHRPKADTSRSPHSDEELLEPTALSSPRKKKRGLRKRHRHHKTLPISSALPRGLSLSDPTSNSSYYPLSSAEIYGCLLREFSALRKYLTAAATEPVESIAELTLELFGRYRGNEMTVIHFMFDAAKEMPEKNQERLDHLLYQIHSRLGQDPLIYSLQTNEVSEDASVFFLTHAILNALNDAMANPSTPPEEVAQCVFNLLNNYRNQSATIAHFISYSAQKMLEKHQTRLHQLLFHLFLNPNEIPFFSHLWKCMPIHRDQAASFLVEKSKNHDQLLELIGRHTEYELTHQNLQTLFREDNFSSLLCKHYGISIEGQALRTFYAWIHVQLDALSEMRRSQLCFEMRYLRQHCLTSSELTESQRDQMMRSIAEANASHFLTFAAKIIKKFYKIPFSPPFHELMTIRRTLIERFISQATHSSGSSSSSSSPSTDLSSHSLVYIGEILFLRILNGQLFQVARNEQEKTILISISKLFQQLSNETELGEQHPSYIRFPFNQFCLDFRPNHREFIDRISKNR